MGSGKMEREGGREGGGGGGGFLSPVRSIDTCTCLNHPFLPPSLPLSSLPPLLHCLRRTLYGPPSATVMEASLSPAPSSSRRSSSLPR